MQLNEHGRVVKADMVDQSAEAGFPGPANTVGVKGAPPKGHSEPN
jgi:hypothetical protein